MPSSSLSSSSSAYTKRFALLISFTTNSLQERHFRLSFLRICVEIHLVHLLSVSVQHVFPFDKIAVQLAMAINNGNKRYFYTFLCISVSSFCFLFPFKIGICLWFGYTTGMAVDCCVFVFKINFNGRNFNLFEVCLCCCCCC